jgi:hypothetical protein
MNLTKKTDDGMKQVRITTTALERNLNNTDSKVKAIREQTVEITPKIRTIEVDTKRNTTMLEDLTAEIQAIKIQGQLQQKQSETENLQVMSNWLSPLKFHGKQQRLLFECFEPCSQWFLKSEQFLYWIEKQNTRLQCWGDAGSGKVIEID